MAENSSCLSLNSSANASNLDMPTILSPLQKHVRKVVGGFGKKSCVSTGVRKPGNTLCVTDRHDMTLAVKMALNPNTTNQPAYNFNIWKR